MHARESIRAVLWRRIEILEEWTRWTPKSSVWKRTRRGMYTNSSGDFPDFRSCELNLMKSLQKREKDFITLTTALEGVMLRCWRNGWQWNRESGTITRFRAIWGCVTSHEPRGLVQPQGSVLVCHNPRYDCTPGGGLRSADHLLHVHPKAASVFSESGFFPNVNIMLLFQKSSTITSGEMFSFHCPLWSPVWSPAHAKNEVFIHWLPLRMK